MPECNCDPKHKKIYYIPDYQDPQALKKRIVICNLNNCNNECQNCAEAKKEFDMMKSEIDQNTFINNL